jgi:ABC-2 type transport system permease protein
MTLRRVLAIARKEFLHIIRDPLSLGIAIALPMILIILYGYALTLDVDRVPVAVWDQSETPRSRDFISHFQGSRYFSIKEQVRDYKGIEKAIDSRKAIMALVIPVEFSGRIDSGRSAPVQLILDGSDSNTATIALGYAEIVTLSYSQNIIISESRRLLGAPLRLPLDYQPRVWFNTDLESKNYIIPGLIAVIMMVISALLTSLTVAREWERGTMEQLISTPVRGSELIIGKLLPYCGVGMLDVFIAVAMGEFMFQVPLRGSVALLFGTAAIFLVGALSMGMLISIVTKKQVLASQMALITTFLPSFLLSGFIFSIGNMPYPIQVFTYIIPARYFITLLKGIYLKGIGLEVLMGEMMLLVLFGLAVVGLANIKFKKRLD